MIVTILGVLIIVLMAIFIGWIYYYLQVNSPKKSKLKKEEKIQEEIRHCVDCVHWIEGAVLGSYYPNSKFEHSKCGRPRQRDLKEISALELVGMPDPVNIPINETCAPYCQNERRDYSHITQCGSKGIYWKPRVVWIAAPQPINASTGNSDR